MTSYGAINVKNLDDDATDDSNHGPIDITPLLPTPTKEISSQRVGLGSNIDDAHYKATVGESPLSSWYSLLTFKWFKPLLDIGNSKVQLEPEDLETIPLPPSCQTSNVARAFHLYWDVEWKRYQIYKADQMKSKWPDDYADSLGDEGKDYGGDRTQDEPSRTQSYRKNKCPKKPSVAWSIVYAFGRDYAQAGFLKLIHDLCVFVGPIVLHDIIQFLRNPEAPYSHGLLLTFAVTCSQLTMSFCLRHYFFKCYMTGLRMRTAITMTVYEKALILSSSERYNRSVGEIVNLMTVDAQRIQDLTTYGHAVWYSFLQIGIALYMLFQQLGIACLGGVAVIVIMIPLNKYVASWMARLQKRLMTARDDRMDINNEVLCSMKVIKLQAWEKSFEERINKLRENELYQLLIYVVGNCFTKMLWSGVPLFVSLATFATYTWLGNQLDVASALTAIALFDILRFPLFMLPQVINNLVEASISLARVQSFLLSEEHQSVGDGGILSKVGIQIKNATFVHDSKKSNFVNIISRDGGASSGGGNEINSETEDMLKELREKSWEVLLLKTQLADVEQKLQGLEKNGSTEISLPVSTDDEIQHSSLLSLRRINFDLDRGQLIAVVGNVGSGKSSLINSILGEVRALSGSLAVKGRLAYAAQTPFIFNDTLKQNVLFARRDETFDEERYQLAISACALHHDLNLLSDGDETEIGEKGITLSGGQKARVSLARALYDDADIYLLDDPLAAVDAHVGRHIFQKCIIDEMLLQKSGPKKAPDQSKSSVILVTNAIQYLSNPLVDKIVVLNGGSIVEVGTFTELSRAQNSLFFSLLSVIAESGTANIDDDQDESVEDVSDKVDEFPDDLSDDLSEEASDTIVENIVEDDMLSIDEDSDDEEKSTTGRLMTNEMDEREKGHVGIEVYWSWIEAAGGIGVALLVLLGFTIDQSLSIASKWFLTYWSRHAEDSDNERFLNIFAAINIAAVLTIFLRIIFIFLAGLKASRILFSELLRAVMIAPMRFFDTTPIGRIVNRFSKDIYTIDEKLVSTMGSYLSTIYSVLGVIIVISTITPIFAVCLIPMIAFYLKQQEYFTKTYRELKRLDSVHRSPLYALLGETLDGVSTIRAYGAQRSLLHRIIAMLDRQQNAYFLTCSAQCWLAIKLELIGTMIIFCACFFSVAQHKSMSGDEVFAGLAGLSISFSLAVTQSLNWSVRMSSDLEANFVSVERVRQYCNLSSEAPHYLPTDTALTNWPQNGKIDFSSVKLRYRKGLPLVLKGLDITIPPNSKVGVVGRTGAGKSTIMLSILRLVEMDSGSIQIDGVNIATLGLNLLRSKVAVIPQDPVIFSGTVRSNLDPFNEWSDDRLIDALQRVGLMAIERSQSYNSLSSKTSSAAASPINNLSDIVAESGNNFSVGQRQLLVIARSLLCQSIKIVIMDEATASVDPKTDALISNVIRKEFRDSTTITIAHRINTILDSDFILVMDDGQAAEFDTPQALLSRGGHFKELVDAWEEDQDESHY